jgi:hypothetical protein
MFRSLYVDSRKSGFELNEVGTFAEAVWQAAGIGHLIDTAATEAAKKYKSGEKEVYGLPGLADFFGEESARKVAKLLEYSSDGDEDVDWDVEPGSAEAEQKAPAFSEMDLALKFSALHANDLRYVAAWNKWYRYDGKVWKEDKTREIFSLSCAICRQAAWETNKKSDRKGLASAKTRAAVVSLAGDDRRLAATIDQWDADPWLLNTPDGVIDLRTGERREARADNYMSKMTSVSPNANCNTPLWSACPRTLIR